jgi:hypothetical protein
MGGRCAIGEGEISGRLVRRAHMGRAVGGEIDESLPTKRPLKTRKRKTEAVGERGKNGDSGVRREG